MEPEAGVPDSRLNVMAALEESINVAAEVRGNPRPNESDAVTVEALGRPIPNWAVEPSVLVEVALTGLSTGPTLGASAIK